jgi:hypothetical protein
LRACLNPDTFPPPQEKRECCYTKDKEGTEKGINWRAEQNRMCFDGDKKKRLRKGLIGVLNRIECVLMGTAKKTEELCMRSMAGWGTMCPREEEM